MASSQKNSDSFAGDVELNQRRIKTADRSSFTQQTGQIRNIRTSSMPGAPLNQDGRTRATIDEEFLADYQTKGIQPQSVIDRPQAPPDTPPATRNEVVEYTNISQTNVTRVQQGTESEKPSKAKKNISRIRATSVNLGIMSWGLFSWMVFQLPFAVLSLVLLGIAGAVETVARSATPNSDDGFFITAGKKVLTVVGDVLSFAIKTVSEIIKLDLSVLNPNTFFMITYFILFAYGVFMLLIMYLIYKIALLNPLFGEGGGFKFGMFLLTFIGYALPFFNLFPWFLVWAAAVWKYPK
jgi:hypothetical protein